MVYEDTSKMKLLGIEYYGITMPNTIQPREYSKGGGKEGILYITDSDGDLNVFNVERNSDSLWLNTNYGNPDNFWNGDNRFFFSVANYFISIPLLRESFVFGSDCSSHQASFRFLRV